MESSSEPRSELSAADSSTADAHGADRSPARSPPCRSPPDEEGEEDEEGERSPVQDMMMRALQLQMKPREKSGATSKERTSSARAADSVSKPELKLQTTKKLLTTTIYYT